jgi:hypothetical protein
MAKRLTLGGWKPRRNPFAPPKQADEPAHRRYDLERTLCEAIGARKLVTLIYEDDFAERTFAPHAVYTSTKDKVCVSGVQLGTPDGHSPKNFEVGKIRTVNITRQDFQPTPVLTVSIPSTRTGLSALSSASRLGRWVR